jgi:hypothetical protein
VLADYEQLVADLVRDDATKLALAEKDRAIAAAVERYSEDRPQEKAEDLTPTSANELPLPAAWVADFSVLRSLEYPIGDVPPTFLDQASYALYRKPSGLVIQTQSAVRVAAGTVRATYTYKHVLDAGVDTIPVAHRQAVASWAAAVACRQLAAFYSSGTDSTIQADSVEQQSKSREYAKRAGELEKFYLNELGIEDKRSQPAGTIVTPKQADSWGGPRLNHPAIVQR